MDMEKDSQLYKIGDRKEVGGVVYELDEIGWRRMPIGTRLEMLDSAAVRGKTRKLLEYIRDYGTPITIGERAVISCSVNSDALSAAMRELALIEDALTCPGSQYTHDMTED
jgi:hypothetical protein